MLIISKSESLDDSGGGGLGLTETCRDSSGGEDAVSLFEFSVHDSVGESLTDNTDTFKYTVTSEEIKGVLVVFGMLSFMAIKLFMSEL